MISVVIPTYDRMATLPRAVGSVLAQTHRDLELIVVDDGSTDGTGAYVAGLEDPRVSYVRLPGNRGAAAARNEGVRRARGELVAFLDSDDAWHPDKLERQLACLRGEGADAVLCRTRLNGYGAGSDGVFPRESDPPGPVGLGRMLRGALVQPPALLARREVLEAEPFDETLLYAEDEEWAIRAALRFRFWLMDEVLGEVYLQPDSVTNVRAGLKAGHLERLLGEFADQYALYPASRAEVLRKLACCRALQGEDSSREYFEAFRLGGEPRDLLKAALARLGLIGPLLARRDEIRNHGRAQ